MEGSPFLPLSEGLHIEQVTPSTHELLSRCSHRRLQPAVPYVACRLGASIAATPDRWLISPVLVGTSP
jgi:hypothetical protein